MFVVSSPKLFRLKFGLSVFDILAHLSWKLMSFLDNLFVCHLSICVSVCKLFTFSSSSPEPLATGQYLKIFFSRTTGPKSTKLSTEQPLVKEIQVCSVKHHAFLAHLSWKLKWAFLITCHPSSVCLSVCPSIRLSVNFSHFHLLLQNHWANFNQTWHKASLGEGNSSLFKRRALPFSKGRYLRNIKNTLTKFKNLLLQNHWANFPHIVTMHPWVKGIQVCSNEGPRPFPRGDDYKLAKIHWRNLKIVISRTTEPISTKLGTKHPWERGIKKT